MSHEGPKHAGQTLSPEKISKIITALEGSLVILQQLDRADYRVTIEINEVEEALKLLKS